MFKTLKHFVLFIIFIYFQCVRSVNTHMHADHITGTGYLKQLLPNVQSVISHASGAVADKHLSDGDVISFGHHEIKAVSTPGHTNGCMTFINYKQVILERCSFFHFQ